MTANLISICVAVVVVAAMAYVVASVAHPRITDSGWLWLFVFSGMGLLGLLVIGPKYNDRQSKLETRFEARQQIDERAARLRAEQAGSDVESSSDAAQDHSALPDPTVHTVSFIDKRPLQVSLTLLGSALAVTALVSGCMLVRAELPKRRAASEAAGQSS